MRVEVDPDIGVSARTVGELRKLTAWPDNMAIMTPPEPDPESAIKVSKASTTTRVSRNRKEAQVEAGIRRHFRPMFKPRRAISVGAESAKRSSGQ